MAVRKDSLASAIEPGRMRVTHNGEVVCDVPVKGLTDEAPVYERPMKAAVSSKSSVVSSSPAPEANNEQLTTDVSGKVGP